MKNISKK